MSTKRKNDEDDPPSNLYIWEKNINASWENVKEDEEGRLIAVTKNAERERYHLLKKSRITKSIRRGLIRFVVVALDLSLAAGEKDYRPSRLEVCKSYLQQFFLHFYDQNPISQLSLIVSRDRLAEKISDLSGNPKHHIQKLQSLMEVKGLVSLQNTLLMAGAMLKHIPNYGSRELIIIYNSLSTCDPGNIYETISLMQAMKIRVNIICLSAEIYICKHVSEATGGMFAVATDQYHLQELLSLLTVPPADLTSANDPSMNVTDFIYMGFPKRSFDQYPLFSYDGKKIALSLDAYSCPRCATRTTDIPTQCCVCGLQLNSSSHIARSFHHLFPVPQFIEYTITADRNSMTEGTNQFFAVKYQSELVDPETSTSLSESDEIPLSLNISRLKGDAISDLNSGIASSPPPPPPPDSPSETSNKMDTSTSPSSPPPPPPPSSPPEEAANTEKRSPLHQKRKNSNRIFLSSRSEYSRCRGCFQSLLKEDKVVFRCPSCTFFFCVDCDLFIHETLHNCPSC